MKIMIPREAASMPVRTETVADAGREESSLHGEILAQLRDYIVEGNIPDGGRVPERQLCAMFGISRTPLREALKVLASEGLVDLLPSRGARVRQLSEHELGELFDVMGGLGGSCRTSRMRNHHRRGNRRNRTTALRNPVLSANFASHNSIVCRLR
jgi:DNA-binding GntR family transcriptional regulator